MSRMASTLFLIWMCFLFCSRFNGLLGFLYNVRWIGLLFICL